MILFFFSYLFLITKHSTLNSVSIIVSEFVPFGANQVVQLNGNLGSTERVQGGFFTALLDESGTETTFEVPPGLTSINILDYSLTRHANFEADIHFPEAPGIVQVEMFGCSLNYTGICFYGMQVEAVLDRIKDNISLDHLARLLVDVHQDSSKIVDACLSAYQRKLMNIIYLGDAAMRDKVNLIVSNEITPHLTAEEYMDKGEYENELKQGEYCSFSLFFFFLFSFFSLFFLFSLFVVVFFLI